MAIPRQDELYNIVLESLKDGKVHELNDIRRHVKRNISMTRSEAAKKLPSGRELLWQNRLGWSIKYLKEAGLISRPQKAHYRITKAGKQVLLNNVALNKTQIVALITNYMNSGNDEPIEDDFLNGTEAESDFETFERLYNEINSKFADTLLSAIADMSINALERLTNQLLKVLKHNNEVGIRIMLKPYENGNVDGLIYAKNAHGFDLTYIQFDRQNFGGVIDENNVLQFIESMVDQSIDKGLFITTATFSEEAKSHVADYAIHLVDGVELAELMIAHNIGIEIKHYKLQCIDKDFFSD